MTHLQSSTTTSTASVASRLQSLQNPDTTAAPPSPVILSTSYRVSLISLILRMCSSSAYANVTHFEWYIDRLVELSYIAAQLSQEVPAGGATLGSKLRDQLVDVCARVKTIRPYAVKSMAALLSDDTFLENGEGADVGEVLGAAAWICGEYCRCVLYFLPLVSY
jgi:AP-3 complex subunit delta-1